MIRTACLLITTILTIFAYNEGYTQPNNKETYRAARYSTVIDHSILKDHPEIMAEIGKMPLDYVSFKYFIQYGPDLLIEIIDAGNGPRYMPIVYRKFNLSTSTKTTFYYFRESKEFMAFQDSIACSYEEYGGIATKLCSNAVICDTVKYVSNDSQDVYIISFDRSIHNLPLKSLFYPDIQYLPTNISESNGNIKMLDEVINGKGAVDTLLSYYNYKNYRVISNDLEYYKEKDPVGVQRILEFIEKVKKMYEPVKD